MKYILVIGDGMADNPVPELGNKTPLESANIPCMDAMAAAGTFGSVLNVPEGFPPGSDTAIMSIFGCAPQQYYTGRAPIELADQGVTLPDGAAAFRCNNICVSDGGDFDSRTIVSHSAGGIGGADSRTLVEYLFSHPDFIPLAEEARASLLPADSYRHVMIQQNTQIKGIRLSPPHDHLGESVKDNLPSGCEDAEILCRLMRKANEILDHHPLNEQRRAEGKLPANAIWFWAEGTSGSMPNFQQQFGHTGTVISAVPLVRGIAKMTGLKVREIPTANGEWDTDYEAKVAAALEALETDEFVAVHLEGPDESTHEGSLQHKLQSIEWLDSRVISPLATALSERGEDFRMLILSDHKTLMADGTHDGDPVPYIIYDSRADNGNGLTYCEKNGELGPYLEAGTQLMPALFLL
jgi:2,3-bisphosphoglycerate-independent phosphoglycerate mutase